MDDPLRPDEPAASQTLPLSPDELLTTTRTVRKRLDLERPVPRSLISECIEISLQAPSGSMRQNWHWIAVDDPEKKRRLAEIYREIWGDGSRRPEYPPEDPRSARRDEGLESVNHLLANLERVPWLIFPCGMGRPADGATIPEQIRFWASIYPAMWSFMLAARARSLGCAWTTLLVNREAEVADVLGIPYPDVTQCGMFPLAYSIGTEFRPAFRLPAAEITHWNQW